MKSTIKTTSRPVVFVSGEYGKMQEGTTRQLQFLKAMNIAQDPKRFKQIIRARAAVDVFRTLDKIALRKEWMAALERNNLDLDSILQVLKKEMNDPDARGSDRIKAAQIILKSLGLEKYEDASIGGGTWEDEIVKIADQGLKTLSPGAVPEYEVTQPVIPESVKKQRKEQNELGRALYE